MYRNDVNRNCLTPGAREIRLQVSPACHTTNDEYFFRACASFGLPPGLKLKMETHKSSHVFSELALTVNFISEF